MLSPSASFASLSAASAPDADSLDALDALPSPKVRFEQQCVLIPDPVPATRMPRLVTKSYSLPLWKRKRDPSLVSESEDDSSEDHIVFKVSVPSITTKSRSPSCGREHRPLVSCLVHNAPSSSDLSVPPSPRIGRPRRASLPAPVQQPDAITIPLRACCAQCYSSIDKCMKEGDHWEVHFSRGAIRRRKSVSDAHTPSRIHRCVRDAMPGFDAVVAVDEIDRRRRSTEVDPLTAFTLEMANPSTSTSAQSETEEIPLRRAHSLPDAVYPCLARVIPDLHRCTLSPPILEEDEHRPSPRRTPISSPLASSTNLPATRVEVPIEKPPIATPKAAHESPSHADHPLVNFDNVFSSTPITLTPPSHVSEKGKPSAYFADIYSPRVPYDPMDSPSSSPSTSPQIGHARSATLDAMNSSRKKPMMHIPGSIFRASTQMLKGISGMNGMPMGM